MRDLIGHLVGCPIELTAGHVDVAGGEEWTQAQAQVEARRDRSVADLMAEWQRASGSIDAAIRAADVPVPVAHDILTHEQDLRGAIGAAGAPDPVAVRFLADGFCAVLVRRAGKAELAQIELRDPETGWSAGTEGGVVAEASEYEWSRALTGRRSGRQVAAFGWSADPTAYLDVLCPFGPLPEADIDD